MSDDTAPPKGRETRILSLWLPSLPTDRLARLARRKSPAQSRHSPADMADEVPTVVAERISNALRLSAIDAVARARGLEVGMSLADARAIAGQVNVHQADRGADFALLNAIADWCDRYTPLVALDAPELTKGDGPPVPGTGLYLDISGCAHLFGGEQRLRTDLLRRLAAQGFEAQAAIAATAGAAWALARYGERDVQAAFVARGAEGGILADLPVAALRLDGARLALLDRLGLKRIGQLAGKPRAPLAARFGSELLRRLDQAMGREDEPLSPRRPVPILTAERQFSEPVSGTQDVQAVIGVLAARLDPVMEKRGIGARLVELSLYRTDGQVVRAAVGTARPVRDAATIAGLFCERLDALGETFDTARDVFGAGGHGFDMARLCVVEAEARDAVQLDTQGADLLGGGQRAVEFDQLVDRLGARLGLARIARPVRVESHLPERAVMMRPIGQVAGPVTGQAAKGGMADSGAITALATASAWVLPDDRHEGPPDRPLRLFSRPELIDVVAGVPDGPPLRFRWRRVLYDVTAAEGPERIAPEWWREANSGGEIRDYYRVEDGDGRRYWLYRSGLYSGGPDSGLDGAPDNAGQPSGTSQVRAWYVHGLFA